MYAIRIRIYMRFAYTSRVDPMDAAKDETSGDGGPALFRLVRFWSRRWTGHAAQELTGEPRHVPHILAVEAVHTTAEANVGTVAHQLGLDHSGASRMVRDAVAAGYLVRAASAHARRSASLGLRRADRRLGPGRPPAPGRLPRPPGPRAGRLTIRAAKTDGGR